MSDADHIWVDKVEGPRCRGTRSLYFGRRLRSDKLKVRIFADGSGAAPQHTDVELTLEQARELTVWLVTNVLRTK